MPTLRDSNPRHLAALVAVADAGSFGRAAELLGFTQSAVSQQIAQLERAAGQPLLDRPSGPRAASLNAAGLAMVDYARRSLARIDRMDEQLDLMRRGLAGRLNVGTFQSASAELLPNVVGRMRRQVPDIDVRLDETDDLAELIREVLDGDTDMAFTVDVEPDPRLRIDLLGFDPFVVVAPAGEGAGPITSASDLEGRALIGQPHTESVQTMIDRRLIGAGIDPDYSFRFQNNAAVQSMVRSGMGWAVMPSLAVDLDDPGVDISVLHPPLRPRAIQLISRADRTLPAGAEQFAAIAISVGAELLRTAPAADV
jgi:DNA-binding transcriptional LysR family regulator